MYIPGRFQTRNTSVRKVEDHEDAVTSHVFFVALSKAFEILTDATRVEKIQARAVCVFIFYIYRTESNQLKIQWGKFIYFLLAPL